MDLKKSIGYKIYNLRTEHDLSQEEFTYKLKTYYSRANLSKIENGIYMPNAEFVKAVCEAFNVSSDWLLEIPSPNISRNEKLFLNKFNRLKPEARQTILNLMDIIIKGND